MTDQMQAPVSWINPDQHELLSVIAPTWYRMLKAGIFNANGDYDLNFNYDIMESKSCVVGESHFFDKRYRGCAECQKYSNSFAFYSPMSKTPKNQHEAQKNLKNV